MSLCVQLPQITKATGSPDDQVWSTEEPGLGGFLDVFGIDPDRFFDEDGLYDD